MIETDAAFGSFFQPAGASLSAAKQIVELPEVFAPKVDLSEFWTGAIGQIRLLMLTSSRKVMSGYHFSEEGQNSLMSTAFETNVAN